MRKVQYDPEFDHLTAGIANVGDEQRMEQFDPLEISRKMYDTAVSAKAHIQTLKDLGDVAIRQYREEGYLVVEKAIAEGSIKQALEAIGDAIHGRTQGCKLQYERGYNKMLQGKERENMVRKVYDYVDSEPRLAELVFHPDIMEAAEKIVGEPVMLVQADALLKPPGNGREKPWHQDMAYGDMSYDKPLLSMWIALDGVTPDNGCMYVIPRSHMDGCVPHYSVRDWQICDSNVCVSRAVSVPLQPGGAFFFHGLLHHGSPCNKSDQGRRALQFHYVGVSAKKLTPREYKRYFTNELTDATC